MIAVNPILNSIIVDRQELESMLVVLKGGGQVQDVERIQQLIEYILERLDRVERLKQVTVNGRQSGQ